MKEYLIVLLIILTFSLPIKWALATEQKTLEVGILGISMQDRSTFDDIRSAFEKDNPGTKVSFTMYEGSKYKAAFPQWLLHGDGPDVLSWQGGHRLYQYLDPDLIIDLSGMWAKHKFADYFSPSAIKQVTFKNKVYGLPFSSYTWGIFYNKPVFEDFGLKEPKTWEQFLYVCAVLKANRIFPIAIGNKNAWPASAWFSYITMRTQGLSFYYAVLKGEIPFSDPRIHQVFVEWKKLIDLGYFGTGHEKLTMKQAAPALYRGVAGMMLNGQFFSHSLPQHKTDDIGFFAFPSMDPAIPNYEHEPLNILTIPAYSQNKELAERFLTFVSKPDILNAYNQLRGTMSPIVSPAIKDEPVQKTAMAILQKSAGNSQFLDRDTSDEVSTRILAELQIFMIEGDIERIEKNLETLRKKGLFAR